MSKWTGGEQDLVQTAVTAVRHGETDKTVLEVVSELNDG